MTNFENAGAAMKRTLKIDFKSLDNLSSKPCVATLATQTPAGIGHNGGPDTEAMRLFDMVGPRTKPKALTFECSAPWVDHTTEAELMFLAVLQRRIAFKEQTLQEARKERRRIMNRCIRRMGRDGSKT